MTGPRRAPALLLAAVGTLPALLLGAPEARAVGAPCTFPAQPIAERPWSLQRVLLDRLWQETRGEEVTVAVIDSGVDTRNPQLAEAVPPGAGADVTGEEGGGPTVDPLGHGTRVAGIIAAREHPATGFVGLAPAAAILPIRQTDSEGNGDVAGLIQAIDLAVAQGADVINISQDTTEPLPDDSGLRAAVDRAVDRDVLIVASAGNEGADGRRRATYPAAYEGVLAVAASDRNNERASFSQSGEFVDIAAPGVDMVSTVPGGGQCVDHGTSFAAPFVSGVAALVRAEHPDWTAEQVSAHLRQTAERAVPGPDPYLGWGVVDPVRALTEDAGTPPDRPVPDEGPAPAPAPDVPALAEGETHADRDRRLGRLVLLSGAVLTAVLTGTALVLRDARRRRPAR
ncbi:type VII secretion-associated serine protease mycosin [Streptomyces sp. DSM 44917]|uniref:Type VII secretion-associated serine protease mycosin n=1 Tax=Streptomyces boetiae TaxID=3075541 RepID=A0ABU2LFF0_9ACTN|nr:type VII secretion-associated serine protease mycosin [Streptomyces sp. DSM 44917]MDT0310322.1 type VII secretion-associated serine protease mycosin [Streptomyces sp. DSM 44917]